MTPHLTDPAEPTLRRRNRDRDFVPAGPHFHSEEAAANAQAGLELTRSSPFLRFVPEVEDRYQRETQPARWRHAWVCIAILQVAVWLRAFGDAYAVPDVAPRTFPLWIASTLAAILLPAALCFGLPKTRRRAWHMEAVGALLCLPVAGAMLWSGVTTHPLGGTLQIHDVLWLVLWSCLFARHQFGVAVALGAVLVTAVAAASVLAPSPLHTQVVAVNAGWMALVTVLALAANRLLERRTRRIHVMRQLQVGQRAAIEELTLRLREQASRDPLTGLRNRRQFEADLAQAWSQAAVASGPIAALLVDIDFFKRFNDRHGHPAGDACLQQVARVLDEVAVRHGGFAARLGGEEFVVLLPTGGADTAMAAATAACQAVRVLALPQADADASAHVTASIGVAVAVPHEEGVSRACRESLLRRADDALHAAKARGRDRALQAGPATAQPRESAPMPVADDRPADGLRLAAPGADPADALKLILDSGFRALRFPATAEKDYQTRRGAGSRHAVAGAAVLGMLVLNAQLHVSGRMVADVMSDFSGWLMAASVLLLVVAATAWTGLARSKAEFGLGLASTAMVGVALYWASRSHLPTAVAMYPQMLAVPMLVWVAARLPFRQALLPAMATLVATLGVAVQDGRLSGPMLFDLALTMSIGIGLLLLAAYRFEHADRADHLLEAIHRRQKKVLLGGNRALRSLSHEDALTRLGNRRRFDKELEQAWAGRAGRSVSLLIIDIDHFKRFNDHYGHPAGDACLQRVAAGIGAAAQRAGGLAVRLGGKEFAVLLPTGDANRASRAAADVCVEVRRTAIAHERSDTAPHITASVGAATVLAGGGAPSRLLSVADDALYEAKHAGGDRAVCVQEKSARRRTGAVA